MTAERRAAAGVYFGLIRIGFAYSSSLAEAGHTQREYRWAFLHWAGRGAPEAQLGLAEAIMDPAKDMMAPYHLELSASSMHDIAARTSARPSSLSRPRADPCAARAPPGGPLPGPSLSHSRLVWSPDTICKREKITR